MIFFCRGGGRSSEVGSERVEEGFLLYDDGRLGWVFPGSWATAEKGRLEIYEAE